MPFVNPGQLPRLELFPGIVGALVAGEKLMLSFLELAEGAEVVEHSHPHEQAGLVLEGKLRFRIGDEEKVAGPGDAFIIPPNVVHWGVVEEGPAKVLDIFSPLRDDYLQRYNQYAETGQETIWK
jgi:quercetin dioxygenase-like cupin family protein